MQNYLRLFVVQTKRNIFMTTGINTQSKITDFLHLFTGLKTGRIHVSYLIFIQIFSALPNYHLPFYKMRYRMSF
jgi:hypothetical protein